MRRACHLTPLLVLLPCCLAGHVFFPGPSIGVSPPALQLSPASDGLSSDDVIVSNAGREGRQLNRDEPVNPLLDVRGLSDGPETADIDQITSAAFAPVVKVQLGQKYSDVGISPNGDQQISQQKSFDASDSDRFSGGLNQEPQPISSHEAPAATFGDPAKVQLGQKYSDLDTLPSDSQEISQQQDVESSAREKFYRDNNAKLVPLKPAVVLDDGKGDAIPIYNRHGKAVVRLGQKYSDLDSNTLHLEQNIAGPTLQDQTTQTFVSQGVGLREGKALGGDIVTETRATSTGDGYSEDTASATGTSAELVHETLSQVRAVSPTRPVDTSVSISSGITTVSDGVIYANPNENIMPADLHVHTDGASFQSASTAPQTPNSFSTYIPYPPATTISASNSGFDGSNTFHSSASQSSGHFGDPALQTLRSAVFSAPPPLRSSQYSGLQDNEEEPIRSVGSVSLQNNQRREHFQRFTSNNRPDLEDGSEVISNTSPQIYRAEFGLDQTDSSSAFSDTNTDRFSIGQADQESSSTVAQLQLFGPTVMGSQPPDLQSSGSGIQLSSVPSRRSPVSSVQTRTRTDENQKLAPTRLVIYRLGVPLKAGQKRAEEERKPNQNLLNVLINQGVLEGTQSQLLENGVRVGRLQLLPPEEDESQALDIDDVFFAPRKDVVVSDRNTPRDGRRLHQLIATNLLRRAPDASPSGRDPVVPERVNNASVNLEPTTEEYVIIEETESWPKNSTSEAVSVAYATDGGSSTSKDKPLDVTIDHHHTTLDTHLSEDQVTVLQGNVVPIPVERSIFDGTFSAQPVSQVHESTSSNDTTQSSKTIESKELHHSSQALRTMSPEHPASGPSHSSSETAVAASGEVAERTRKQTLAQALESLRSDYGARLMERGSRVSMESSGIRRFATQWQPVSDHFEPKKTAASLQPVLIKETFAVSEESNTKEPADIDLQTLADVRESSDGSANEADVAIDIAVRNLFPLQPTDNDTNKNKEKTVSEVNSITEASKNATVLETATSNFSQHEQALHETAEHDVRRIPTENTVLFGVDNTIDTDNTSGPELVGEMKSCPKLGKNMTLECRVTDLPQHVEIKRFWWVKRHFDEDDSALRDQLLAVNGRKVVDSPKVHVETVEDDIVHQRLVLSDISAFDTGVYMCQVGWEDQLQEVEMLAFLCK